MADALYWTTAVASLAGVWLNIRKRAACFWIWACTNATWAGVDLVHGIHAQAAVQAVYFGLSIYGIVQWRRDGKTSEAS